MGFIVAGCGGSLRFGRAEYKLQHAPCRIVHAALRQTSIPDCRKDFLFHIGAAAGHIQIAACAEARNPVIHRPPVRNDHTIKAPFSTQYIRQQFFAVGAVNTVQLGVGAHDRSGTSLSDGNLKSCQV